MFSNFRCEGWLLKVARLDEVISYDLVADFIELDIDFFSTSIIS